MKGYCHREEPKPLTILIVTRSIDSITLEDIDSKIVFRRPEVDSEDYVCSHGKWEVSRENDAQIIKNLSSHEKCKDCINFHEHSNSAEKT